MCMGKKPVFAAKTGFLLAQNGLETAGSPGAWQLIFLELVTDDRFGGTPTGLDPKRRNQR